MPLHPRHLGFKFPHLQLLNYPKKIERKKSNAFATTAWHKPSLTKLGKSSGALFSFCIRLFCSSKRFSSYGFLLFVFPEEDRVGNKAVVTKPNKSLRLIFSSTCDM